MKFGLHFPLTEASPAAPMLRQHPTGSPDNSNLRSPLPVSGPAPPASGSSEALG
jgi:hypothetical protein